MLPPAEGCRWQLLTPPRRPYPSPLGTLHQQHTTNQNIRQCCPRACAALLALKPPRDQWGVQQFLAKFRCHGWTLFQLLRGLVASSANNYVITKPHAQQTETGHTQLSSVKQYAASIHICRKTDGVAKHPGCKAGLYPGGQLG